MDRKFIEIKNKILGKDYDLSWAFISPKKIQKLNLEYRNIDKPTDILSFPLSKKKAKSTSVKARRGEWRRILTAATRILSIFCLSTDVSI
jgi:ssRNA-specific RNase YbeY (16S rRNA maturation enzyme)